MTSFDVAMLAYALGKELGPGLFKAYNVEPCTHEALFEGDLIVVDGVALKNAQGHGEYEAAAVNSHWVTVLGWEVHDGEETLVVGNPDLHVGPNGLTHDRYGENRIPLSKLSEVWRSTRHTGEKTEKGAVVLRRPGEAFLLNPRAPLKVKAFVALYLSIVVCAVLDVRTFPPHAGHGSLGWRMGKQIHGATGVESGENHGASAATGV